jgi:hypothetical protein
MTFLDDSYKRSVMRQVGAAYQFRHLQLQKRLATDVSYRWGPELMLGLSRHERLSARRQSSAGAIPVPSPSQTIDS